jgi:hypothetical protein
MLAMSLYRRLLAVVLAVLGWGAAASPVPAAPFTQGDILVTSAQTLFEVTPSGAIVQAISVPVVEPFTGMLRDVVIDSNGNAQLYNGTFHPVLTTYNPSTNTFTNTQVQGLSTGAGGTYGGIAAFGNYVFLTSTFTANNPTGGLIRVDINNPSSQQKFANGIDFVQVAAASNGLIYGLEGAGSPTGTAIGVYDPNTLALVRTIPTPTEIHDIAVAANGDIFAISFFKDANGKNVYHLDPNGKVIASIGLPIPFNNFVGSTVDISANGDVLLGTPGGELFLTNESFAGLTLINVPSNGDVFATFVQPPPGAAAPAGPDVPEPATLALFGVGLAALAFRRLGRRTAR